MESYEEDVPFHVLLLMNLASRFGKISSVCTTANDDIFHLLHLEKEKEASTQQKLFTFQKYGINNARKLSMLTASNSIKVSIKNKVIIMI